MCLRETRNVHTHSANRHSCGGTSTTGGAYFKLKAFPCVCVPASAASLPYFHHLLLGHRSPGDAHPNPNSQSACANIVAAPVDMPYSRITFDVRRRVAFPESALILLLVSPATGNGLRGLVVVQGANRYSCYLEGQRPAVIGFRTYLEHYLTFAVGDIDGLLQSDGHATEAFPAGMRVVMPE